MSEQVMTEYTKAHLKQAIKTMRDTCDEAERKLDYDAPPLEVISMIINSLAWGYAHATTSIQTAINGINREWEKREWERLNHE